jgi:hypothetical protein
MRSSSESVSSCGHINGGCSSWGEKDNYSIFLFE